MNSESFLNPQESQIKTSWVDYAQLVLSVFILLSSIGNGILIAGLTVFQLLEAYNSGGTATGMTIAPIIVYGLPNLVFGVIAALSIVTVSYKLAKKEVPAFFRAKRNYWLWLFPVLFVMVLVGGAFLARVDQLFAHISLALMLLPLILLPVLWFLRQGSGRGLGENPNLNLGLTLFTYSFSTPVILIFEMMSIILVLLGLLVILFISPELKSLLTQMMQAITLGGMDKLNQVIAPLLQSPWVIGIVVLIFSVFAPLFEELFKTLGVWFLCKRTISPREGYIAGLFCGASFALFEGLLNSSQGLISPDTTSWLTISLGRLGGTVFHMLSSGLIAWALAKTWQDKKHLRAILVYLGSMLVHGLWNAMALLPALFSTNMETPLWGNILMAVFTIALLLAFLVISIKITRGEDGLPLPLEKSEV